VLRRHPYSESSLVVAALTRRHGLQRFLARGAYRPRSRYFAVLDYFDELELEWTPSRSGDLHALLAGTVCKRRRGITRDLERYCAATSVLELATLGARPGLSETALYDSLSESLDDLDRGSALADAVRVRFELGFLRSHGLTPALGRCAACGGEAPALGGPGPARVHFSAGAGGRLCEACAADSRAGGRRVGTLPLDVLESAARMLRGEELDVSPEHLVRVRDFVERFLGYHLETRPRSQRSFLSGANRNAPHLSATPGD
jgi:DNA repair protein RecO (recombination protein O)